MNSTLLFSQFNSAINWNATYYVVFKSSFLIRTFILFRVLTSSDFSLWASLNSMIFLLLLWSDCGLKKSIPRFAPSLKNISQSLIKLAITAQLTFAVTALPVLYYCIRHYT
jgi:hypothetical protein